MLVAVEYSSEAEVLLLIMCHLNIVEYILGPKAYDNDKKLDKFTNLEEIIQVLDKDSSLDSLQLLHLIFKWLSPYPILWEEVYYKSFSLKWFGILLLKNHLEMFVFPV